MIKLHDQRGIVYIGLVQRRGSPIERINDFEVALVAELLAPACSSPSELDPPGGQSLPNSLYIIIITAPRYFTLAPFPVGKIEIEFFQLDIVVQQCIEPAVMIYMGVADEDQIE